MFNIILAWLGLYVPIVVIIFSLLLILFAEVSWYLRQRYASNQVRVWVEIITLSVALAVLATLIDWWLASR